MIHSPINYISVLKRREEAGRPWIPAIAQERCSCVGCHRESTRSYKQVGASRTSNNRRNSRRTWCKILDAATTSTCHEYWWHKAMRHELQNNHTLYYYIIPVLITKCLIEQGQIAKAILYYIQHTLIILCVVQSCCKRAESAMMLDDGIRQRGVPVC